MNRLLLLRFVFFFLFLQTAAWGQSGMDTLGLTGSVADTVVGNRLFEEMKELINKRKWEEAELKGEQAKVVYARLFGEESKQVANIWGQNGRSLYLQDRYDEAIEVHQFALNIRLKIFGEQHPDVSNSYNYLGLCYHNKGDFDKAIEYHLKALNIRLSTFGEDNLYVAESYHNLGNSLCYKGEYDKSIGYDYKSLNIKTELLGEKNEDVADSYNSLGVTLEYKGEYDLAVEHYQKALDIRLKIFGFYNSDVAQSFCNIGDVYKSIRFYKKAEAEYLKALSIRQKLFSKNDIINSNTYTGLADMYNLMGNYKKSVDYYLLSLNLMQLNNAEESPDFGIICGNTSTAYLAMNDIERSMEYSKRSQKILKEALGETHPYYAISIAVYADILNKKKDFDNSIENYKKALSLLKKSFGDNHPHLGTIYNNLAEAYLSSSQYSKAIEMFQKSLEIFKYVYGEVNATTSVSYQSLGKAFEQSGDLNSAINFFTASLSACNYHFDNNLSAILDYNILIESLNEYSKCQQSLYYFTHDMPNLEKANDLSSTSVKAIDYLRKTFPSDIALEYNYLIFENAIKNIDLITKAIQTSSLKPKAFQYAEKSKASLLQAQIKASEALSFSGIPDSILQQEQDLRINITWREKQRQYLLDKGLSETDTNTLRISGIIFDLKQQYENLKQRLETQYPEYYRLKYDLSTVSLNYVQDTLLAKDQALLEYFVGDSSLFLFVVRPDTFIVQEVKRDFPLEDWIQGLRHGLYGYYTADKASRTDSLQLATRNQYLEYAPKLYQKLVAPVAAYLPEKVILVPDGPLGYVPFDALLNEAPQDPVNFKSYPYLLQKHQFSYTYSATLLQEMRDKKHHHAPTKPFAAFAPFYNGDTTLLAGMYAYDDLMRKDLQPLAFSGPEVAAASKLMHGEIVAGPAATEARFTSSAGDYRILHLATHGRADNRVGDYAFLAFSEIKDSIENELLYVKDLYNLELNADLVVLSACETGIGKLQRGEGIISLARAFAYAGAKSIVTTLWEVNDKSTSELMRFFYRELQREKDKDEALRLARQRFIKESSVRNSHPFFWAAFVPLGDMRGIR